MITNILAGIQDNLVQIIITLLSGLIGVITLKIKNLYENKINDDIKRKVVKTVVNAVEQLYGSLDGKEKFKKAQENIIAMLNEKGLQITELEMNLLIEETCNCFNMYKVKENLTIEKGE